MSQAQPTQVASAYAENNLPATLWSDLVINELCYEDEVSDAILALLILKQFEQSTTDSSQEESTEDSQTAQTQPTPDLRRDILSRKRARSPSRELTPCPVPNREAIAHARKRLCTQNFAPSTTALMRTEGTTATTTATSTSNPLVYQSFLAARRGPFVSDASRPVSAPRGQSIAPLVQPVAPVNVMSPMGTMMSMNMMNTTARGMNAANAVKPTTTTMTTAAAARQQQQLPQPPFPRGFRPDANCIKAMRDVKARMTGHATEAHISSVCKKFLQYPKLPIAYLAVCDDSKLELFWMFAGDMGPLQQRVLENCEPPLNLYEKGILKLRMGAARAAPWPAKLQHNSVLQTQHMKEIDARPRPTLQDRVKMWLANIPN